MGIGYFRGFRGSGRSDLNFLMEKVGIVCLLRRIIVRLL